MKINIELQVGPDEVALATELLATLRSLTEHVGKGSSPGPVVVNVKQLLTELLAKAGSEANLDKVAADMEAMVSSGSYGVPEEIGEELLGLYDTTVLQNEEAVKEGHSVAPYIRLVAKLPEPVKNKVRDGLISKVLSHLSKKRPIPARREEFYAHAEAFAVLVNMEVVSIDGAAQTMERLMNKPDQRTAAVTMLGKTVEFCQQQLLTKCKAENLAKLLKALEGVTEEQFTYDKDWVLTTLYQLQGGPGQPARPVGSVATPATPAAGSSAATAPAPAPAAPAAAAGVPAVRPTQLMTVNHWEGHEDMIFTIAYDTQRQLVYSAARDHTAKVWNMQGGVVTTIPGSPDHFSACIDVNQSRSLLVMGAVNQHPNVHNPFITAYDLTSGWQYKGSLTWQDRKALTCMRCLPDSDAMVAGETLIAPTAESGGITEHICHYDLGAASSMDQLPIVHTFREHAALITCIAPIPGNRNLFVSGSQDQTMRVWDLRVDRSVGQFGTQDPTTYHVMAHDAMVTWIDGADNILVSGCCDCTLAFWDIRTIGTGAQLHGQLHRMNIDNSMILKVAITGAPAPHLAAVSTVGGLYMLDYENVMEPRVHIAAVYNDQTRPFKPYHDIKWAGGQPVLFGVSEHNRIDVMATQ